MKTSTTTENGDNFGIVSHLRSEENNRNENQNRHKGNHQIDYPKRIKMKQEISHGEAVSFYSGSLGLYIYNYHNDG